MKSRLKTINHPIIIYSNPKHNILHTSIYLMDNNPYIHNQLHTINLNIDSQTIHDVESFLINDIGFINQIELDYQIYAALAIVSEIKTLPNIKHSGYTKIGIKIENVMSHLGKLSKQMFLDTLNKQLEKLKQSPQNIKKRVQDIRYSYRFYKKYQTTFEALYQKLLPHRSSQQEFSALFWVLFLYIKNTFIQTENITQAKNLLILIFRAIFEQFLCKANFHDIFHLLEQKIGSIPEISPQKQQFYIGKFSQKIDFFYKQRFTDTQTNFNKLMENYTYLDRLVDDISNFYVKQQASLKYYNQIDEISYLQLKKNLTPQVYRIFSHSDNKQVISKQLSFADSDESDSNSSHQQIDPQQLIPQTPIKRPVLNNDNDSIPTPDNNQNNLHMVMISPIITTPKFIIDCSTTTMPRISQNFLFDDHVEATPIRKKVNNQKWMNQKIMTITIEKKKQLIELLSQIDHQIQLVEQSPQLMDLFKQKIYQVITAFTPKCHDHQTRYNKILLFYLGCLFEITTHNIQLFTPDQTNTSKIRQLLINLAALSCEIFNYIHNSISYQFKYHFEIFGGNIMNVLQAFQLFESFVGGNMTIDLKYYLENVKKRFMVSDIWENQLGFRLLFSSQSNPTMMEIRTKIWTFTKKRVQQICFQAKIQSKIISKTINIMNFILDKKPYLLKKNNIDQIILCCIMSCLSINQKHQHQTLQLLFQSYNSNIQFAFNSNQLGLKDHLGNQMKILDYYNQVFLQQIQDLLVENQTQLDDFLLTPVRISQSFNISNIDTNIRKIRQKPLSGNFLFNPQKGPQARNSYRKALLRQQSKQFEMRQEKQENQEDPPSPTFGMKRTMTFCPQSYKK